MSSAFLHIRWREEQNIWPFKETILVITTIMMMIMMMMMMMVIFDAKVRAAWQPGKEKGGGGSDLGEIFHLSGGGRSDLVVNELNSGVLRNSDEKRGTQTKRDSSKFLHT